MQSDNTRQSDTSLKEVAKIFETIGWEKRLCDLSKDKLRDFSDDDYIPF